MAILFQEDWTGSNDAAWDAGNWPSIVQSPGSGGATIQANAGQLDPTGAAYAAIRADSNSGDLTSFVITLTATLQSAGEQYHTIQYRHSDGWWDAAVGWNAYRFMLWDDGSDGRAELERVEWGERIIISSHLEDWGTSPWNLRLEIVGPTHKIRWWQGVEPEIWNIHLDDFSQVTGSISLSTVIGASGTSRPIRYDSLLVEDPVEVRKLIMVSP